MQALNLIDLLIPFNLFLSSANAIIAFSLLVYALAYNPRHPITFAFSAVMMCVTAMWIGDTGHISVLLGDVEGVHSALFWIRIQAVGLAFLPAAYMHFADTLLRSTGALSSIRRGAVIVAYGIGAGMLTLMLATRLIIAGPQSAPWGTHYAVGPFYPVFALYAMAGTAWSFFALVRVRYRCLTATLRRRMTYLLAAFTLPAVGSVTYLLAPYAVSVLADWQVIWLPIIASIGVSPMVMVMAYTVSYHGVLLPDRVIKQRLAMYFLRGPALGVIIISLLITIPRVGKILGVRPERFQIFAVIFVIILLQVAVDLLRPYIDRLIYAQDEREVVWLQEIGQRLLTATDLEELLRNTVIAVCEVLRVHSGFIIAPDRAAGLYQVRAFTGPLEKVKAFLAQVDTGTLAGFSLQAAGARDGNGNGPAIAQGGYWLLPLGGRDEPATLGFLGVEQRSGQDALSPDEQEAVRLLVDRAALALEDVQLQEGILAALRDVAVDIEQVQEWSSKLRYVTPVALGQLDQPAESLDMERAVRDALSHYWGGPKLADNPLLRLRIVQSALATNNNNPSQALRAVLRQAVEALRPTSDGDRLANEWILYNILKLRFLQGRRVKEIVQEFAMSESDFYRKERMAIREVAQTLANMEKEAAKRS